MSREKTREIQAASSTVIAAMDKDVSSYAQDNMHASITKTLEIGTPTDNTGNRSKSLQSSFNFCVRILLSKPRLRYTFSIQGHPNSSIPLKTLIP